MLRSWFGQFILNFNGPDQSTYKKIQTIRLYCRQLIFYIYNFLRHLSVNNADRLEDITRNVVLHVERFLLCCIKRFCSSVRVFISNTSRDLLIC